MRSGDVMMPDVHEERRQNGERRRGPVATLGRITAAAFDRSAISEASGKRLLGAIASAVSERVRGLCLVTTPSRGRSPTTGVLVRRPGQPAIELSIRRVPRNGKGDEGRQRPRTDRFAAGDLSALLEALPPEIVAELPGARSGALAILSLRKQGLPSGMMLVHRDTEAFGRHERVFLRAARAQTALALQFHATLQRADAAMAGREAFLNLVTHELGGPLTTAALHLGTIELAAERNGIDAHLLSSIHMAKLQLDRTSALLRQLVSVARRSYHRIDLQREDVDLDELLESVVENLRLQDPRAASIEVILSPFDVRGRWDRVQIEQVVHNLLGNALKFGEGRPIRVRTWKEGEGVVLEVEDHGIGIHPDDQTRIFECFARAVPDRHYSGLGLGLWLVREIVSSHGGKITVRSQPGEGAIFDVWLPIDEPSPDTNGARPRLS
jgi:signal transduction histidine kinase